MNINRSIKAILSGEHAFYKQKNYEKVTSREMACSFPVNEISYTYNTENKVWRIVKAIFSIILFPIGFYQLSHALAGKLIVPASSPFLTGIASDDLDKARKSLSLNEEWKFKRISVQVDGYTIDATIMGKANTLDNGRWILASNGNGEFYEGKLRNVSFKKIISELNGNALVFNYPGVGASSAMPNRNAMAKAYRAMLNFLEDQNHGIGAKEIIGIGHSIGGGVQGDALKLHQLKKGIKYVFVKNKTFSNLSDTVSHLMNRPFGFLIKIFGWNMSSIESSKSLKAPEIIIQTANVDSYTDIAKNPELIVHDGVIPAEASLAKKLLSDSNYEGNNKYFMGVREGHNTELNNPLHLVEKINEMMKAI